MSSEPATVRELQARLVAELPASSSTDLPDQPLRDFSQPTKRDEMIVQDVCRRHEGLIQLIYHNDRKAVQLIGIYFAIAGATATLLLANIRTIDEKMAGASVAVLVLLFSGIVSAFRSHWTVPIYLTGMKPDFWVWTRTHSVPIDEMIDEYLSRAADSLDANEKVNDLASIHLKRAYVAGILATATAITMITFTVSALSLCRVGWLAALADPLCRLW